MSSRVCYIEREDRGAVLRRLRVLGAQTDDTWRAPSGGADTARVAFATAASWIGDRLNGRLGGRVLDRLCLDVDGSVCSWVTASTTETRLIRAVIEQEGAHESDDPFAEAGHAHAGRFPDLPGEVGYQVLPEGRGAGEGRVRTPVFAVPDVAARAFIDALDESGVQVGSCVTLWQAMLRAWVSESESSHERVVADTRPIVAVVLCVPGDRVVWAWGRSDAPIAAGAFRMRSPDDPSGEHLLEDGDTSGTSPAAPATFGGRLAAEWLAWSAQIGRTPARIVWIGPVETRPGLGGGEIASA
ncbi:MAG: hypothetical protein K8E66_13705, partial [Phycisphaerales bacterium]|nr:hypothetical protein [Phycisphaerales bacterium]